MKKQDYYSILGVNKTVTSAGLKSAYRKLSKQYHPDVNPDNPNAAAKMQEINEAYNTLSDPKKRAEYDGGQNPRAAAPGSGGRSSSGRATPSTKDIFDDLFSGMKGVKMDDASFGFGAGFGAGAKQQKNGPGSDPDPDSDENICKRCKGRGREQVFVSSGFGRIKKIQECPDCGGTGKAAESV